MQDIERKKPVLVVMNMNWFVSWLIVYRDHHSLCGGFMIMLLVSLEN